MIFTETKYCYLDGEVSCISTKINGVYTLIPINHANRHYAEILRQVEAGTLTIEEADNGSE